MTKYAQVLVHYSLALKPGDFFYLRTHPLAQELSLLVIEEAVKAGANLSTQNSLPGAEEIFFKFASDAQLDFINPARRLIMKKRMPC